MSFSVAFSQPTAQRMAALALGAILRSGRHTVTGMLASARCVVSGHSSDFHRLFSRASWSSLRLGRILAGAVLAWIPEDEPVVIAIDDTVARHRGPKVYGKGLHYDAVRSTTKQRVLSWGHRWVVLAALVKFPFARRRWALPVLVGLYRPEPLDRKEKRRHKTPSQIAGQLIGVLKHWFPSRKFVFLGDGGFTSHELAESCERHGVTLVSRFYPDANLYAPPPMRRPGQKGRPRVRGAKLPSPEEVVKRSRMKKTTVEWTSGTTRRVGLVTGTGGWYQSGKGLVAVRWVWVHPLDGRHRDDYLYSTDASLTAEEIVGTYTRRWSIETTFEEVRAHLGFETTRQHAKTSVLRTGPWLLGLFSVVCLVFATQARTHKVRVAQEPWYRKAEPTFSDALSTVRDLIWRETIMKGPSAARGFKNLPRSFRRMLLQHLFSAA